jgi:hypothetical protein
LFFDFKTNSFSRLFSSSIQGVEACRGEEEEVLLTLGWSETKMNIGEGAGDGKEEVAGVDEEDGGRARTDLGVYSSVK